MARPKSKQLPRTISVCGLELRGRNLDVEVGHSLHGPIYARTVRKQRTSFTITIQQLSSKSWVAKLLMDVFDGGEVEVIYLYNQRDLQRAIEALTSRVRSLLTVLSVLP